jgi:hypothetical protein
MWLLYLFIGAFIGVMFAQYLDTKFQKRINDKLFKEKK